MNENERIKLDEPAKTEPQGEKWEPVQADWQWSWGHTYRIVTPIVDNTYTLRVEHPLGVAEFTKLVDNCKTPNALHRQVLAQAWYSDLLKHGLINVADFKQAAEKAKANGQPS